MTAPVRSPAPASLPRLVRSLAAATRAAPTERKLLLAPTRGAGKEMLRALARSGTPWLGWEVSTLRPLALGIVADALAADGRELLDGLAEQALLDAALDDVLPGLPDGPFRRLAEGIGFRAAVRGAVQALRLAGVAPERLRRAAMADRERRDALASVLEAFEARLDVPRAASDAGRKRGPGGGEDSATTTPRAVDTAFVLRQAAEALRRGETSGYDRVWLAPGLTGRGSAGRFLVELERRGARRLEHDPVIGVDPPERVLDAGAAPVAALSYLLSPGRARGGAPDLELFHAASVTNELKEVLRRVMAADLNWDEVEIVTTDPGVYGPALHALAVRMEIPVTFGVGLPVERTRVGQAVEAFFRWIGDDFGSPVLRRLLESGILVAPGDGQAVAEGRAGPRASGAALGRRLRELRVGWGRERYLPAVERALEAASEEPRPEPRPERREDGEQVELRMARHRRELRALQALLQSLLDPSALPPVPVRLDPSPQPLAPAELARGLARFLGHVAVRGEVERTALERLERILRRVEAELTRPVPFPDAVALVREHLLIRVPAPRAEGPAPWRSTGGHLYLTDVEHGGLSGRRATFVVGLDAGRTGAGVRQDPMLLDRDRHAVAPGDLPTSGERLEERRWRLGALLAGLRGRVTLSYSAWDPAEARGVLPSSLLLQALRLQQRDATLGYGALHARLGDPVSAVPATADGVVDAADVWLATLRTAGGLRYGADRVRAVHPGLARGRSARAAPDVDEPGPHHGLIEARPELDPRQSGEVVSASRLETLGTCPRRYLFRYVLDVRPPDDPTLDPEVWLDSLRRGSLLHRVYERTVRRADEAGVAPEDEAFLTLGFQVLEEAAEAAGRSVPPPSANVHQREMEDLKEDVRSFVAWARDHGLRVLDLERAFGLPGGNTPPVELPVAGGRIRLRGAIDRVDERLGHLHLIDYKTGSPAPYRDGRDPYRGGRRLQHVLYSRAAERLYEKPVMSFSYALPTRRGENHVLTWRAAEYAGGMELVDRLLSLVAGGRFLPTDSPEDCRFCDFRRVCRVRDGRYGTISPLAAWGRDHLREAEVYRELREARSWEG